MGRYEAQACLFTIIKVARDVDLAQQIGRDLYFDLVDHDKVRHFRIWKHTPFAVFKEEVATEFGIPVQFQRFWIWVKRQNHTYRPRRPLTAQEEAQPVGQLREVSNNRHNGELKLFLEVDFGPDLRPIPPPEISKEDILLFFKLYDPQTGELRYVGRLFVKSSCKPIEILGKLSWMANFAPDEEIELYEEIRFKPSVMCEHLDKQISFRSSQIEDGDIICFQKASLFASEKLYEYPDVPSFLENVYNQQIVHFRTLEKPEEDDFCLELSKLHSYDDVVERVARQINLDDPSKIRLTSHNCYSQQPKPQPIKYRGVEHLSDMLVHYNQVSDILYYEVLDIPLPELQGLKNLKVAFHHATKDEVVIHNIRLPKQSTVGDLINELKTRVELSHPNAELRLLEVFYHKIYKIFTANEKIENINDQYWTLRAEEIPEEEKNLGPRDHLIHVYHFTKDYAQNQMQVQNFGKPFFLVINEGETLGEIKVRVQKKLQVPDEEFSEWKFAYLLLGRPEYLQDTDIVFTHFQRRDVYGAWEQYLGLEHSDNTPKRSYAVNHVGFASSITEARQSNKFGDDASKKKPKTVRSKAGELERRTSHAVDKSDARIQYHEARDPVVEPIIAAICDEKDPEMPKIEAFFHVPDISKGGQSSIEIHFDEMAVALLEKLEDEKAPNSVRMSDFNDTVSSNFVDVGIFRVPSCLEHYAKKLLARRIDISTGLSSVQYVNEAVFTILCCALKSMDATPFNEITESLILKWRDAIRGALQFGFKVDFLKDHLKSITHVYLGKLARDFRETKELQAIDKKITEMEKDLASLRALRSQKSSEMYTYLRKICETAAANFQGNTPGTGLR